MNKTKYTPEAVTYLRKLAESIEQQKLVSREQLEFAMRLLKL